MSGVKYTKTIYQHQQSCEVTAANTYPSLPLNNHRSWWVFLQNSFEQQAILYYLTLNTFHRFDFFFYEHFEGLGIKQMGTHIVKFRQNNIYMCICVYMYIIYIYIYICFSLNLSINQGIFCQ